MRVTFVCGVALLSSGVLTQPLALHLTQLLVDSLANLPGDTHYLSEPPNNHLHTSNGWSSYLVSQMVTYCTVQWTDLTASTSFSGAEGAGAEVVV